MSHSFSSHFRISTRESAFRLTRPIRQLSLLALPGSVTAFDLTRQQSFFFPRRRICTKSPNTETRPVATAPGTVAMTVHISVARAEAPGTFQYRRLFVQSPRKRICIMPDRTWNTAKQTASVVTAIDVSSAVICVTPNQVSCAASLISFALNQTACGTKQISNGS